MNDAAVPCQPVPPSWPPSGASAVPPFVSAAHLAEVLDDVQLVDVRWSLDGSEGEHTYRDAHLPGAVFVDLDRDLADPPSDRAGRHPLPMPERFAASLGARGVRDDAPVVAYDTLGGAAAARLVWLLRIIGQPASLLDGGLAAWDGPLEAGAVGRPPVARSVRPWPSARLVDGDDVATLPARGGLLLDVRAPERFRGDADPVDPRPGHVPGAVNLPIAEHLVAGGLREPEQLRRAYARLGVTAASEVAVSCGSGINACLGLLALETTGIAGRLYAGSWSAWSRDPSRPVVTGEA